MVTTFIHLEQPDSSVPSRPIDLRKHKKAQTQSTLQILSYNLMWQWLKVVHSTYSNFDIL